MNISNTTCEK